MTDAQADAVLEEAAGWTGTRTLTVDQFARMAEALLVRAGADREHIKRELESIVGPIA